MSQIIIIIYKFIFFIKTEEKLEKLKQKNAMDNVLQAEPVRTWKIYITLLFIIKNSAWFPNTQLDFIVEKVPSRALLVPIFLYL